MSTAAVTDNLKFFGDAKPTSYAHMHAFTFTYV